jgi:hypothetical protein
VADFNELIHGYKRKKPFSGLFHWNLVYLFSFWFTVSPAFGAAGRCSTAATATVAGGFFLALADLGLMLFVPNLELGHGRGFVEESEGYPAQEVLEEQHAFVRENPAHRIGGLGSLVQPFERLLTVDLDGGGNCQGIVGTDLLDEFTIPRRTGIGYDNEVKGAFFAPVALESDLNSHKK